MAVDDGGKGIGHPGVGIDSIELAGFDQGSDDGPVWRPGIVAFEEGVLPVKRDWSDPEAPGDGPVEGEDDVPEAPATPRNGYGLTTTTAPTWASAASHPSGNWKWPRNFYGRIPLKMGG